MSSNSSSLLLPIPETKIGQIDGSILMALRVLRRNARKEGEQVISCFEGLDYRSGELSTAIKVLSNVGMIRTVSQDASSNKGAYSVHVEAYNQLMQLLVAGHRFDIQPFLVSLNRDDDAIDSVWIGSPLRCFLHLG